MQEARITALLIYFLIASAVAVVALALGIAADIKRKAAEQRCTEWKRLYLGAQERCEKLRSENSILRFNAKLPCIGKAEPERSRRW